ncbi:multicopper oxidase family protein [Phycicoccus sp. DTK01]|uniref:multicopper oxidase family protein n=1 Tax=Phycicoccus sp. DTK01 TaxID=2785745 RepID=UPI001A8F4B6A|nr:multicopper oxidase domain-containing protein [Phycicoccus sp. DTK01]GIL35866.1 spore coat protein A [Phycicoccus sp. DTK01]
MGITRRDALKLGVVGGALAALPLERTAFGATIVNRMPKSKMVKPFTLPFVVPPVLSPTGSQEVACSDGQMRAYDFYEIAQTFSVASIMPGYKTPFFGYNGVTPGPTIVNRRGRPIVVHQTNLLHQPPASAPNAAVPSRYSSDPLDRWTSTHLHGSASLPQYDGYASDVTLPGRTKRYVYPNSQEARTLWYHDHGVHHTSQNAYNGLAGMYVLHDEVELSLGIPQGRYDVPMIVKDVMLDTKGGLIYEDNSESGAYGDIVLVNGVPWPAMQVEPRKYRFRILNASVSRSYEWQLHDGRSAVPMTVIGTDAGLMPQPQVVSSLRHGMAERYEVVIDFAPYAQKPGKAAAKLTLKNLGPKNNVAEATALYAMQFVVGPESSVQSTENNSVPTLWNSAVAPEECMTWTEADLVAQGVPQRRFAFIRANGHWTINGETWQDVVDSDYTHCMAEPEQGAVEIWELANTSGGWFHPVHIHLVDFQVLSRNGQASLVRPHEKGAKDVVYVGENETVRVAMRFSGPSAGEGWQVPKGRYMMHCHNLVHEDHDMMMQFSVGDPDHDPECDPITADPAW